VAVGCLCGAGATVVPRSQRPTSRVRESDGGGDAWSCRKSNSQPPSNLRGFFLRAFLWDASETRALYLLCSPSKYTYV